MDGSEKPKPRSPFIGPLPHDEPVLSISESPGDAQDLRPDDSHHGRNTAPEEVDVVVELVNWMLAICSAEVPPMQKDAGYFKRTFFRETKELLKPHF